MFTDPCLEMPKQVVKYVWVYNEERGLLTIYPHINSLTPPAQKIWLSFVKAAQLATKQQEQTFILHHDSIYLLINYLKPQLTWLCLDKELMLFEEHDNIFVSPHPQYWLDYPLIKKQLWQLWQKIYVMLG